MEFSIKNAMKIIVVLICAIAVIIACMFLTNKNNEDTQNKNEEFWNLLDDNKTPISKSENQVGKYVDINGDGTVDGIIFADLAIGGSGQWKDSSGGYTIPVISSSKDYYVSQENYTNALGGTAEVLTPTGSGADRFYIMALTDVSTDTFDWYNSAYSTGINTYSSITNISFGKGYSNTTNMIDKWQSSSYGEKNKCTRHNDVWSEVKSNISNGWFIPSRAEWSAFAKNIDINRSNYFTKGLSQYYWSSSLKNSKFAYGPDFFSEYITQSGIGSDNYIRLARTV